MVQWKVKNPIILIERFIPYSAWGMIFILAFYAAFLISKMKEPSQTAEWRKRSWTLFSVVFFTQLILGVSGFENFLMNPEKLHFPIPALIVAGPIYRGHISFMPILFITTIILAGPAWCSQLCYFGALDNLVAARGKPDKKPIAFRNALKYGFLFTVIFVAIVLRVFNLGIGLVAALAALLGIAGLMTILVVSSSRKKMFHCTVFCPVGTVIRFAKYLNPFRMYIDNNCTDCMACSKTCYYDALNVKDIQKRKPGSTCTLCGDCVQSCQVNAIKYKFLKLSPNVARNLWLVITITIHAVFLGLARL
jgi:ferredoxin-type protein NapH